MNEQRSHRRTELLQYYSMRIWRDISNLIKWMILAVITGCVTGAVSSLFARALRLVTEYRGENHWVFFLLPLSGILIGRTAEQIRCCLLSAPRTTCLCAPLP